MIGILLYPEGGGREFLRNVGEYQPEYTSSKNIVFFIVRAVGTSNLTSTPNTVYVERPRQTVKPGLGIAWIRMYELLRSRVLSAGI
jgi:hypothetical protein